jgi:peptide-methionine (R)-S-oxide reductase
MNRRKLILGSIASSFLISSPVSANRKEFPIIKTEKEWRKILTPAQFAILRDEKTERPFSNSLMGESSNLLKESREGNYICAGCNNLVYPSYSKFDSGTGWPSFYEAIKEGVGYKRDWKLIIPRTEVHCSKCGGHLGHVFDDGPEPTGKRHCINALAMKFEPYKER